MPSPTSRGGESARGEGWDAFPPPCMQWSMNGVCDHGTLCAFSHMPSYRFSALPPIPGGDKFCYFALEAHGFGKEGCRRARCPFNHRLPKDLARGSLAHDTRLACTHWRRGYCSSGDRCVFAHPPSLKGGLQGCQDDSPSAVQRWENNSKIQCTRRGGVCRHWREGECLLRPGQTCKFTHPPALEGIDQERGIPLKKQKRGKKKKNMSNSCPEPHSSRHGPSLVVLAPDNQKADNHPLKVSFMPLFENSQSVRGCEGRGRQAETLGEEYLIPQVEVSPCSLRLYQE